VSQKADLKTFTQKYQKKQDRFTVFVKERWCETRAEISLASKEAAMKGEQSGAADELPHYGSE